MGDFCWIFLKICGMVCATKINGENPKEKIMQKAIFYVRAMRGEGTGESYEDIIARYQAKMQEKGICEIVDSYADGSPLDDLIESDSLIEIKGMCQEQECKYLVIPTADELGKSGCGERIAKNRGKRIYSRCGYKYEQINGGTNANGFCGSIQYRNRA